MRVALGLLSFIPTLVEQTVDKSSDLISNIRFIPHSWSRLAFSQPLKQNSVLSPRLGSRRSSLLTNLGLPRETKCPSIWTKYMDYTKV